MRCLILERKEERKGSNLVLLGLVDKARALRGPLFVVLFGFD